MNIQLIRVAIFSVALASATGSALASYAVDFPLTGTVTSSLAGNRVGINGHFYTVNRERISPADLKKLTVGEPVDLRLDAAPNDGAATIISVAPHNN